MSAQAIALDTKAPKVSYEAIDRAIKPPEPWSVAVRADEPIGDAHFEFLAPGGFAYNVGYAFGDDRTLLLTIPTGEFWGGESFLRGWVADEVGNRAIVHFEVSVQRPAAYSVEMEITHAYGASMGITRAYDATMSTGRRLRD